jgi:hypothetical protein
MRPRTDAIKLKLVFLVKIYSQLCSKTTKDLQIEDVVRSVAMLSRESTRASIPITP